jgi:hypothetical protein
MKYSKDAVVTVIEARLAEIREREQRRFEKAQVDYQEKLSEQRRLRNKLLNFLERVKSMDLDEAGAGASEEGKTAFFQTILAEMKNVGRAADGYSGTQNVYVMERVIKAAEALTEPVLNSQESDALAQTLMLFKTGAPPEVSVVDLRAFGLMQFIKYGGNR